MHVKICTTCTSISIEQFYLYNDWLIPQHTQAWWHIYGSVNWVTIGSGNGLSPNRWQAITWTNTDLLSNEPSGINFSDISIKMHFNQENAFKNVCHIFAILFCPCLLACSNQPRHHFSHWDCHKMTDIVQTIHVLPNAFNWKKCVFWLKYDWSLFLGLVMTWCSQTPS